MTSPIPLVRTLQSVPDVKSVITEAASWPTTKELEDWATPEEMEMTSPMLDELVLRARAIMLLTTAFSDDYKPDEKSQAQIRQYFVEKGKAHNRSCRRKKGKD
jgi:hypothetical protein